MNKRLVNALKTFMLPTINWHDQVPGGKADRKSPTDFDAKALEKGALVELEHTGDPILAIEIAMDHLTESPDYYDELEKMEKKLENKGK